MMKRTERHCVVFLRARYPQPFQVLPSAILADAARAETKGPALSGRASYLHLVVTRLKDRLYRQRQFQREGS